MSPLSPRQRMMDQADRRIVALLQDNARMSNADIARQLELVPSAILQRIRKLEERGIIRGYRAEIDPAALDCELVAYIYVRTAERLADRRAAEALRELPEVLEIHDIAGDDCYLIKVRVRDTKALHHLLHERLGRIPQVESTRSVIVLDTLKESTRLPLPPGNGDEPNDRGT